MKKVVKFKVGEKVQWSFAGKLGATGTVLRIIRRPTIASGGVRSIVEVRWSTGVVGRVEDRKLVKL